MAENKKIKKDKENLNSSINSYIKVVIRPNNEFKQFKTIDVDSVLDIKRVHGRREDNTWSVQAWIVSKKDFTIQANKLTPKNERATEFLSRITHKPLDIVEL